MTNLDKSACISAIHYPRRRFVAAISKKESPRCEEWGPPPWSFFRKEKTENVRPKEHRDLTKENRLALSLDHYVPGTNNRF